MASDYLDGVSGNKTPFDPIPSPSPQGEGSCPRTSPLAAPCDGVLPLKGELEGVLVKRIVMNNAAK